jgi:uncharacterized damage-inducible protein DinB
MTSDLRYPIGKFQAASEINADDRAVHIATLRDLPLAMQYAVNNLDDDKLDTPYREGGWTIRQVIHHVADSHVNSYIRFKLALTEENPTIRPYKEERWAELPEARSASPEVSLHLIAAIHARWVLALENMQEEDWSRTFFHPESQKSYRLDIALSLYAWHSNHHLAHITHLRQRMKW